MNKFIIILSFTILLIAHEINHVSAGDGIYAKLELGYSKDKKFNGKVTPAEIHEGGLLEEIQGAKTPISPFFGVEVGYYLPNNFRVGLSFHQTSRKFFKVEEHIDPRYENIAPEDKIGVVERFYQNASLRVKTHALLMNVYYDFNNFEHFTPYLGVGVGVARHKSSAFNVYLPGHPLLLSLSGKSKKSFAWSIFAGLQVPVNEKFSLDFNVKYFDYGKMSTGSLYSANNVTFKEHNHSLKSRIKGAMVGFGVVYKF